MKSFIAQFQGLKVAQIRGMALTAAIVVCLDWSLKASDLFTSIPHAAERPTLILVLFSTLAVLLLSVIPRRWMMVGCGVLLGGCYGNLIDLQVDGVVWDMIPLPGGIYANLADVAIVSGLFVITLGSIIHFVKLWHSGYFLEVEASSELD